VDLAPLNPRLVYASMTAYGERGDEAAAERLRRDGAVGAHGLDGPPEALPGLAARPLAAGMGDHPTGVTLFAAIMTALYRRAQTDRGTMVSTSLMANGLWWNAIQVPRQRSPARASSRGRRREEARDRAREPLSLRRRSLVPSERAERRSRLAAPAPRARAARPRRRPRFATKPPGAPTRGLVVRPGRRIRVEIVGGLAGRF